MHRPLGCPKSRILADLVSVQCAATLLRLQRGLKKRKQNQGTFGIAIHFSISRRLARPNVFLFIRRHYSPSSSIEKSTQ